MARLSPLFLQLLALKRRPVYMCRWLTLDPHACAQPCCRQHGVYVHTPVRSGWHHLCILWLQSKSLEKSMEPHCCAVMNMCVCKRECVCTFLGNLPYAYSVQGQLSDSSLGISHFSLITITLSTFSLFALSWCLCTNITQAVTLFLF